MSHWFYIIYNWLHKRHIILVLLTRYRVNIEYFAIGISDNNNNNNLVDVRRGKHDVFYNLKSINANETINCKNKADVLQQVRKAVWVCMCVCVYL